MGADNAYSAYSLRHQLIFYGMITHNCEQRKYARKRRSQTLICLKISVFSHCSARDALSSSLCSTSPSPFIWFSFMSAYSAFTPLSASISSKNSSGYSMTVMPPRSRADLLSASMPASLESISSMASLTARSSASRSSAVRESNTALFMSI